MVESANVSISYLFIRLIKDKIMSPYPQKHQCGTIIICRQVYQSVRVVYWSPEKSNNDINNTADYDTNQEFYINYDCII